MNKNKNSIEEEIKRIEEGDENIEIKKWNEKIIPKILILLPSILFTVTYLKANTSLSGLDLMRFVLIAIILICISVVLRLALRRK
tara:strand:+ start:11703 stop:11957 length:255 start_codon:yes stop_codon:yes gene_type:complete